MRFGGAGLHVLLRVTRGPVRFASPQSVSLFSIARRAMKAITLQLPSLFARLKEKSVRLVLREARLYEMVSSLLVLLPRRQDSECESKTTDTTRQEQIEAKKDHSCDYFRGVVDGDRCRGRRFRREITSRRRVL
jgi:hypothetical protein